MGLLKTGYAGPPALPALPRTALPHWAQNLEFSASSRPQRVQYITFSYQGKRKTAARCSGLKMQDTLREVCCAEPIAGRSAGAARRSACATRMSKNDG